MEITTVGQNITHINKVEVMTYRDYGPSWEYTDYDLDFEALEKLGVMYRVVEQDDHTDGVETELEGFVFLGKTRDGFDNKRYNAPYYYLYIKKED